MTTRGFVYPAVSELRRPVAPVSPGEATRPAEEGRMRASGVSPRFASLAPVTRP